MLIKSYFDESYNERLLCVAGYSFTSKNARDLDVEWRKMLARHGRLPYFRMSACNANQYPFDKMSSTECTDVATEAIRLVNKYAGLGYAITVDKHDFRRVVGGNGFVSTPYEFCAWLCLSAVKMEFGRRFPIGGTSFFFESGFEHEKLAKRLMSKIFTSPELREKYNYKAHAFVDKIESRPTQAADLLAWQWFKDSTRRANGLLKPRGDLLALTKGTPHYVLHADGNKLQYLLNLLEELASVALTDAEAHRLANCLFEQYRQR